MKTFYLGPSHRPESVNGLVPLQPFVVQPRARRARKLQLISRTTIDRVLVPGQFGHQLRRGSSPARIHAVGRTSLTSMPPYQTFFESTR